MSFLSHSAAQKATESIYFISYDWCLRINSTQKVHKGKPSGSSLKSNCKQPEIAPA